MSNNSQSRVTVSTFFTSVAGCFCPWSSRVMAAFLGHCLKKTNLSPHVSSSVCLVDSVKEKWWQMCVIWCLTRDRGSLSPLCALTDHINISESYSVRRRSYGPVKEGHRVEQASSDRKTASGGIWGDWTWRVLAVRFSSLLYLQNLVSFIQNYSFSFGSVNAVVW